jgi:exopolyphosphatase/guanosine-5'-triphosphate,3'-diphosphate pyrophosphatase
MGRRRDHFAAIDVGTNAARLKIARGRGERLDVVHSERAAVQPGEGVFERGVMARWVVDRLVGTLHDFADVCRFHDGAVRAVATSALRSAENRDEVVARVQRETGLTLEVIGGEEEARLTALGVLVGAAADERALCIDVGGGSTEIMLGDGEAAVAVHSVEVGGVRLMQGAGGGGGGEVELGRLRAVARGALARLPRKLACEWMGKDATAIGCSGSVRALVAFATAEARRYVTRRELSSAVEELARMSAAQRARFFDPRRAGVILPAAVILEQAMEHLEVWAVRATRRGLRDGILVELSRGARAQRLRAAS